MFGKLLNKNKEREPKAFKKARKYLIEKELEKEGYDVGEIQAIQNNYLAKPENPKYKQEFEAMQAKREEIKARYEGDGEDIR